MTIRTELLAKLKTDKGYRRYRNIYAECSQIFPLDATSDELELIMRNRLIRTLSADDRLQPKKLVAVSIDEADKRARLSEILINANRCSAKLNAVMDVMTQHISTLCAEELRVLRTKGERDGAIESILSRGWELLHLINATVERVNLIIQDIDQSSYNLNRMAKLVELLIQKENIVSISLT